MFSNDKRLIVDILDEEIDKDMTNDQREALINLLYTILHVSKENWYDTKLEIIKVNVQKIKIKVCFKNRVIPVSIYLSH